MPLCRAKAYCAASQGVPSAVITDRISTRYLGIYLGYQQVSRDIMFPGQGAMLIHDGGTVIGALTSGAGIGPFVKFEGVEPEKLIVDSQPTNLEDLITCYALNEPYQSQHGDDMERWMEAYGTSPEKFGPGTGFSDPPTAVAVPILDQAIVLSDAAMAEADKRNTSVAIAVVDRCGDLVQMDRMDNAAPMTPDIAEAVAVTAVNFQCDSGDTEILIQDNPALSRLSEITPFKFLPLPGGIPILDGNGIAGALGVSGGSPEINVQIAKSALEVVNRTF